MHRSSRLLAIAVLPAILALGLAACGSSSKSSSSAGSSSTTTSRGYGAASTGTTTTTAAAGGGAASTLKLSADPGGALTFDKSTLAAKSGKVTIVMTNPTSAGITHAVAVEGNGLDQKGATAQPGGTSTVSVTLKPGTYTFYCPVDGHKAAGMQGKLTVT